jgi:hypothetical protein
MDVEQFLRVASTSTSTGLDCTLLGGSAFLKPNLH